MAVVEAPILKPSDLQRIGTTTSTLTIAKLQNHKRKLIDVFVKAGASSSIDIKLGAITMARIFDNLAQALLVSDQSKVYQKYGFLWYLSQIIPDYPFYYGDQDEDITITRTVGPTRMDAYFQDIEGPPFPIKGEAGGSQSTKHLWIQNLSNQAAIAATGNSALGQGVFDMPTGLSLFTDSTRLSVNNKFTLYAIAGNFPINVGSKTTRAHIFDERIELFTSLNNEGLFVDSTVVNELASSLSPLKLWVLNTPYVFNPNRLMKINIDATFDGVNNLLINTQQLFLIGIRELVAGAIA